MDKEKVIHDLELCTCNEPFACRDCSHNVKLGEGCTEYLLKDALELLKEPKPVESVDDPDDPLLAFCGECGHTLGFKKIFRYCPYCGNLVKWND